MADATCSAPDCEALAKYRAACLCNKHWQRLQRLGRLELPTIEERFWSKVEKTNGCWFWIAAIDAAGYGRFVWPGGQLAHRFAYELLIGPIPEGLDLDHQCHNADKTCAGGDKCPHRRCVNPVHLEPATRSTNNRRGRTGEIHIGTKRTHCKRGHELTPDNVYTYPKPNKGQRALRRQCRICQRAREARNYQRRRHGGSDSYDS